MHYPCFLLAYWTFILALCPLLFYSLDTYLGLDLAALHSLDKTDFVVVRR